MNGKDTSWLGRLKAGLGKTSSRLSDGINSIFSRNKLDRESLEELEDLLIVSDLGVDMANTLSAKLEKSRFEEEVSADEIRIALAKEIAKILKPISRQIVINAENRPHIILVVGVNGSGKTTTIGKFAKQLKLEGKSVMLAAGDTFRAAATEQLHIWGERTGSPVIAREQGADVSGLIFEAIERAKAAKVDVLLIDTAGRLQNREDLMQQLQKVLRVIEKQDPSAPHDCILVLDSTTGQNAHSQVANFLSMCKITGLVLTKLDGSARGGVIVALSQKFALPVHAIGIGEGDDDLRPLDPEEFARTLVGLNPE